MFNYVIDKIKELPWGSGDWKQRSADTIKYLVLHQALGAKATAAGMNSYHIASDAKGIAYGRGWPHIAYHFVIERDGSVIQCNDVLDIVFHAKGANTEGIGICICGNFEGEGHIKDNPVPAYQFNSPTPEQILSLEKLVTDLLIKFNLDPSMIKGHSDFGKPACPGFEIENWKDTFISLVTKESLYHLDNENQEVKTDPISEG